MMKYIFFYGLFMDEDILKEKGLTPLTRRLAYATGYGLRIGERATLVKSVNERVYGNVIGLNENALDILYGEKSVADYVPEPLAVIDMLGNSIDTISYILPMEKLSGSNAEYAVSLSAIARKNGLPEEYIREVETWIEAQP